MRGLKVWLKWGLEGGALYTISALLLLLPLPVAGAFMGWLARKIGPLTRASQVALSNLSRVFPDQSSGERAEITGKMWDNLGHVFAEMCLIHRIAANPQDHMRFEGVEAVEQARDRGDPVLFVSGHFGNWEIASMMPAQFGMDCSYIYREPNNPLVRRWVEKRRHYLGAKMFAKGTRGGRALIKGFQQKKMMGVMIDQKLNTGQAIPFLGHPAMSVVEPFTLALKYGYRVFGVFAVRGKGSSFTVRIKEVHPVKEGNISAPLALAIAANRQLEDLIREFPEQWFFVHNRWHVQDSAAIE